MSLSTRDSNIWLLQGKGPRTTQKPLWLNLSNKQKEILNSVKDGFKRYCQHFKTWGREFLALQAPTNKMSHKMVSKEYF